MTPSLIFGIVLNVTPEQTAGSAPAIKNDPIKERLVSRSDDERVVLVRFLLPGRPPVEHERFEAHFAQASADVVGVIRADALLFHADTNQVIMKRRIAVHAVILRKLARSVVSGLGQERSFVWIDRARRKRDQRITQIGD